MPQTLKVLIVEDSHDDAELLVQELRRAGFEPEWHRVNTETEYLTRLQTGLDLVLARYQLPQFSGHRALELLKEGGLDIPFIFVSDTIGEEVAVTAMRQGATDYLIKSQLARLGQSVSLAMEAGHLRAERRRVEKQLLLQSTALETVDTAIIITDAKGIILWVNPAFTTLTGYSAGEAIGQTPRLLKSGKHDQAFYERLWAALLDGKTWRSCFTNRRKDGTLYSDEHIITPVRSKEGAVTHFVTIMNDVTERIAAEEELRTSEKRFRQVVENIHEVFRLIDIRQDQILYVSPGYESIWGRTCASLLASPGTWFESIYELDRDRVIRAAAAQKVSGGLDETYRIVRPDGAIRWIRDRTFPILEGVGAGQRLVGVAEDVTPRKQLESQLIQAQKMEAVGQLAGGLAHDFNNVLTVVTGYARILLDWGTMPAEAIKPLSEIFTAGTRAANLTRQLMVFSRKQTLDRRVVDLNRVVGEIADMLCRLIGEHVKLDLALSPSPCTAELDEGMMEQVLMNLTVNARDAMSNGGVLTISTEMLHIEDPASRHQPEARAGKFVCLSARDTGCGIPPENLARIFEPFFTTKDASHGTGLGLAMVFGIVKQHQGWIELESTVGVGTCFRVLVPAASGAVLALARASENVAATLGGAETVLLVEDEVAVRELAVAVLRSHGYRVLQAGTARDALEVWKWHRSRIALLFSDLVLPDGMGGLELAAALRKEKPALKVVLTSGYAKEMSGEEFRPPPGAHFIHKPYKPQVLAQAVRDALDERFGH